jgi:hypothetical protein
VSTDSRESYAVIDRIEDGRHAVLLLEAEGFQIVIPVEELPEGASEGDWLRVVVEDERLVRAQVDSAATKAAKDSIREKMNRLRQRGRNQQ